MFAAYEAAVVPLQLNPQSRQPDLNRKPAVYETAALPLRYDGRKKVDNRKRSGASGLEDRYGGAHEIRWISALRRPERSVDLEPAKF